MDQREMTVKMLLLQKKKTILNIYDTLFFSVEESVQYLLHLKVLKKERNCKRYNSVQTISKHTSSTNGVFYCFKNQKCML